MQFVRGAKLTGRLLTNGAPRDQAEFANISAYVTQDDHLYPQLVRMLWACRGGAVMFDPQRPSVA